MKSTESMQWFDVRDWGVEGKGWARTGRYFDRLPTHAKHRVSEPIWRMSHTATGMCTGFKTDAPEVFGRWFLQSSELREPHMSTVSFSGLDLYARDGSQWRWIGWGGDFSSRKPTVRLVGDLPVKMREYRVYLPLRNPLVRLEIGVAKGAKFTPVAPRRVKPIVHYGSSIVHGAYASRPGMVHTSIIGRHLNHPIINLGFSGQAKMEQPIAELLSEIDAEAFIIDPLPNMEAELVTQRGEAFLTTLCKARPLAGLLLVESFFQTNAWANPRLSKPHLQKWKAFRKVYRTIQAKGLGKLCYLEGRDLLGNDDEGTVDSVHPNDLGYMRMAERILPVLQRLISC